jgi:hypothetical protein
MQCQHDDAGISGGMAQKAPNLITGVNPAVYNRLVGSTLTDPNPSANLVSVGGEGDQRDYDHKVWKLQIFSAAFLSFSTGFISNGPEAPSGKYSGLT